MSFTSDKKNTSKDNLNYISYQDIYIDSDLESYPDSNVPILDTDLLSNSSKISYDEEITNKYLQNKSFDVDNFSISSSISDTPSFCKTINLNAYNTSIRSNAYNPNTYNKPSAIYDRIEYKKNIIKQNTYFNKEFHQIVFNYIIFNSK